MDNQLYKLHLAAGQKAGIERTCGKKVKYSSEERALRAAEEMNNRPTTRNILEPYPCYFCNEWHIGKAMSLEFLLEYTR